LKGSPQSKITVLGWEFDLKIEVPLVQSQSPTVGPGLVKTTTLKSPKSQPKKGNASDEKISWPSLMISFDFWVPRYFKKYEWIAMRLLLW